MVLHCLNNAAIVLGERYPINLTHEKCALNACVVSGDLVSGAWCLVCGATGFASAELGKTQDAAEIVAARR
jgi:hypothetical protein